MGCDIHPFIQMFEYKDRKDLVKSFCGEIAFDRNYGLFGLMAGVRGGPALIEPKGIPKNLCWYIEDDYYLRISDDKNDLNQQGYCTSEKAREWVSLGLSRYFEDKEWKIKKVSHPDNHTESWFTTDEFERVLNEYIRLQLSMFQQDIVERHKLKDFLEACDKRSTEEMKKRISEIAGIDKSMADAISSAENGIVKELATLQLMKFLEKHDIECQLVFWFDN